MRRLTRSDVLKGDDGAGAAVAVTVAAAGAAFPPEAPCSSSLCAIGVVSPEMPRDAKERMKENKADRHKYRDHTTNTTSTNNDSLDGWPRDFCAENRHLKT